MKIMAEGDRVLCVGTGDIEVADIPQRVSVDRMRLLRDGRVVDISRLDEIWVERTVDGRFLLHAEEYPGAVRVAMRYEDRHRLRYNDGHIVLLSDEDYRKEIEAVEDLRRRLAPIRALADMYGGDGSLAVIALALVLLIASRHAGADMVAGLVRSEAERRGIDLDGLAASAAALISSGVRNRSKR